MRKALIRVGLALGLLLGGLAFTAAPAQATIAASGKVCNSSGGFDMIVVYYTDYRSFPGSSNGRQALFPNGACTNWLDFAGLRVDTDPTLQSHSYKLKVTDANGNGGSYGPCHEDSDNHASDPPNPGSDPTRVYYRNYDHGNCT